MNTSKPSCRPGTRCLKWVRGVRRKVRSSEKRIGEKKRQDTSRRRVLKVAGGRAMGMM